ncbi:hypothetical protein LQZ18_08180 [Lachnospiraceae bacterium ZAX-1]
MVLLVVGLAIMAVPFIRFQYGKQQTKTMLAEFVQATEKEGQEDGTEETQNVPKAVSVKEDIGPNMGSEAIGLIEIEDLGICYLIREGAGREELSYAIGHIPNTAGIGKVGKWESVYLPGIGAADMAYFSNT